MHAKDNKNVKIAQFNLYFNLRANNKYVKITLTEWEVERLLFVYDGYITNYSDLLILNKRIIAAEGFE